MFTPEHFRAKAAECGELAKTTNSQNDAIEFKRRERSLTVLADNEQWLADHYEQIVHAMNPGGVDKVAPVLIGDATTAVAQ